MSEVEALREGERVSAGHTDPAYWNFNGPFGGWIASQLLERVLDDPRRRGDPISTSTSFVGPIEHGAFTVHVRLLRANRSTDFWWAELRQVQADPSTGSGQAPSTGSGQAPSTGSGQAPSTGSGQELREVVCAYATVGLALRRSTPLHLDTQMPAAPPPEDVADRPRPLKLAWFAHFEMRMAAGEPFRGQAPARSLTWTRKKNVALNFSTLTEICDTAIPRLFFRTRRPVPVATVTMNVFFHARASDLDEVGADYVLCDAGWNGAFDGYFDEQQSVWSRAGRLLATTEQIVWFRLPEEENSARGAVPTA